MSFTKKQIKEINTALSLIVGEVTREQAEAIVRSVMTPSSYPARAVLRGSPLTLVWKHTNGFCLIGRHV